MQKKIVASSLVALFALLGFMAVVLTDFHDRAWPQDAGVESELTLDFSHASLDPLGSVDFLVSLGDDYGLGLFKAAPDLSDTGKEVFVALNGQEGHSIQWFGGQPASIVLGPDRLIHSSPDGTYYVQDSSQLDEAVDQLQQRNVGVVRTDASVLDTVRQLASESGFFAPVLAATLLMAALSVFWLASQARSRALRVLAGGSPWRIQGQDVGGFLLLLTGYAMLVAVVSCALVATLRGWIYVPVFAGGLLVFEGAAGLICTAVILVMSCLAWPSADLFATRRPAVGALRGPARVVQASTLLALIACAGPAWTASQDAGLTARQLATWNELSDQAALTFALGEEHFDPIAPDFARMVTAAEEDGAAAMSYTITADDWDADFGPYSAISIVTPNWLELVGSAVDRGVLEDAGSPATVRMLEREFGAQFDLWREGTGTDSTDVIAALSLRVPTSGITYPVASGPSGQLSFRDDVLLLIAPSIDTVFNDSNIISLASSGNIVFTGVGPTQQRLEEAGLDGSGLERQGVPGAIYPLYAAEQGILQAQYAAYLARVLTVSVAALAVAFLIATALNATIAALLNARRDFPMRLSGATWERSARSRALKDLTVGGLLLGIVLAFHLRNPAAIAATAVTGVLGLATLYCSHGAAAAAVFSRVTHRKL